MTHRPAWIAPLYRTCPRCGAEARYEAGAIVIDGVVHWSVDGGCAACGDMATECGRGEVPGHVREALIAAHGEAVLRAEPRPGGSRAAALKTVRELFGVPLPEVRSRLRALEEGGVKGTEVESRLLAARLEDAGFSVSLRVPEPPARSDRLPPNPAADGYARWPANAAAQGRPVITRAPFRAGEAEAVALLEAAEGPDLPQVELVPGSLAEELRDPLARFLAGGSVVVIAVGFAWDPLASDPYDTVRPGLATDGTWTWDLAWEHWVRVHGCAPPAEFTEYARARGFVPPPDETG
ncbi:hypothetical protein ABZ883_26985 [Streptomyces sp. NPDC046977]|uniref:hypothetical protein n=1 Tax=Streptomyces sp. NPDC046977 TaxID=3154703 RepID=UPI0033EA0FD8